MAGGDFDVSALTPETLRQLLEQTPAHLSDLKQMVIHMGDDWQGYFHDGILQPLQSGSPDSLTHVRMVPWRGNAVVIPAQPGESGAQRLRYTRTRSGATVSFYRVMRRLHESRPPQGRVRVLPVHVVPVGEVTVLVVTVKGTTTIPARQLRDAEEQVAAAAQNGESPVAPEHNG